MLFVFVGRFGKFRSFGRFSVRVCSVVCFYSFRKYIVGRRGIGILRFFWFGRLGVFFCLICFGFIRRVFRSYCLGFVCIFLGMGILLFISKVIFCLKDVDSIEGFFFN